MNKINSNNFDFLRVLFALTVAFAHIIALSGVEEFQAYKKYFNTPLAINGFFVISGFLIAKSYESTKSIKQYIFRRINRIIPAYFFVILLCAFSFYLISNLSFNSYFFSGQLWKYLIANLTFQNYIEPCLPNVFINNSLCTINGALWTIKIEEAFYLLLPIFYWLFRSKHINIFKLSVLIYISSRIYFHYFLYADLYNIAKQLPGALSYFLVGILMFRNFEFMRKQMQHFIVPCLSLFVLEHFFIGTHILKPISYGMMVFYAAYGLKFLNHFGKYGDFTYGIYIYHFPIIQLAVYMNFYNNYNALLVSTIILLVVLVLAILSWHLLELRFLSKGRRLRQKQLLLDKSEVKL